MIPPDLDFDSMVAHAFDHPEAPFGSAWHFDPDAPFWTPRQAVALAHLTRLFRDPVPALAPYTDAQVGEGFAYLVSTGTSGDRGWFYGRQAPVEARVACLEAVGTLFERLFEPRCAPVLGHLDEPGGKPLNGICYMWWDTFPCLALPDDPDRDRMERTAVAVMERILGSDNPALQESALHGLGHAARGQPHAVERAVDRFFAARRTRRPEIEAYARAARCGCVL